MRLVRSVLYADCMSCTGLKTTSELFEYDRSVHLVGTKDIKIVDQTNKSQLQLELDQ